MMCLGLTAIAGLQVHPVHEIPGRLVHVVPNLGAAVAEHPRHSHQGIQQQVSSLLACTQTFMALHGLKQSKTTLRFAISLMRLRSSRNYFRNPL